MMLEKTRARVYCIFCQCYAGGTVSLRPGIRCLFLNEVIMGHYQSLHNGGKYGYPMPCLEHEFRPAVLEHRLFRASVGKSGRATPLKLAVATPSGQVLTVETVVYGKPDTAEFKANVCHAERLVKSLLWIGGGSRIIIAGSNEIAAALAKIYAPDGERAFDYASMTRIYETPLTVEAVSYEDAPAANEPQNGLGRHFEGCRIGFDLGASDRKCAAVQDGKVVFSEEVVWDPSKQADPAWHREGINDSIRRAAAHLPRVDAIGGSAAGVYINNRVRMASLFRSVPPERFEQEAAPVFEFVKQDWNGVPFAVVNDGEAAALAASVQLGRNGILGVSFGSSMAGGYVNGAGCITGRLNELAFVPVDYSDSAPRDEWSGDRGCGVNYFSQQGAARLAANTGLVFSPDVPLPQVLLGIQFYAQQGDERALNVFRSIGTAFGYTVAGFCEFYPVIETAVIMGRVTSGVGGDIIRDEANRVLSDVFPELKTTVAVPDDSMRRHGQAVAAATLPET
jgi:predicted NBD/HSP70 family sugar kinase